MGNWNNFEKWSVSLIISQKNRKQIRKTESRSLASKLLADTLRTLSVQTKLKVSSPNTAPEDIDTPEKAQQLDDNYEAFDKNSVLMPFQAQPDCQMYKFKVL